MGITAKPSAMKAAAINPLENPKLRNFVQGGGSPAASSKADDGVKFTLPIPGKLLTRLERHREALPIPTKRIQWILQAIAEKLERDGY